ncbi:MAG TPA: DUF4276 family protein [Thermosulfurimonas dismutans]|uniref:DUF4276 family protein n=1 Tax=Thermosulfurimonas dismutans TaxID=999894 RepID=A0A7C3GJI2_9BACT|nr:DUF4276 family protein [Thermosulfurimonas dismutans]
MALVVGYFASAGETEIRALPQFLQKISPNVLWKRCFPAKEKPAPKFRGYISPKSTERGTTGHNLVRKIKERLQKMQTFQDEYDIFLVIDDTDCQNPQEKDKEFKQIFDRFLIRRWIGLWALPEIESWFIADPENSFHKVSELKQKYVPFINKMRNLYSFSSPEDFNNLLRNKNGCHEKLSDIIRKIFETLGVYYKKGKHSVTLLKNVEPDNIARNCPVFRERLSRLREEIQC